MQILTGGFDPEYDPQIFPSRRGPVRLSNTVLLGATRVSIPTNGLSRVQECDRHTYRRTDNATGHLSEQLALSLSENVRMCLEMMAARWVGQNSAAIFLWTKVHRIKFACA